MIRQTILPFKVDSYKINVGFWGFFIVDKIIASKYINQAKYK